MLSQEKAEPQSCLQSIAVSTNKAADSVEAEPSFSRVSDAWVKPAAYGSLNIFAATSIVFANKAVLSVYGFGFTTALTLLHTLTTVAGMAALSQLGLFAPKRVPIAQVSRCAASCLTARLNC